MLAGTVYSNFLKFSRANPENPNESILVFGDVSGKVNALIFCASTISLFDRPAQSHTNQQGEDTSDVFSKYRKEMLFLETMSSKLFWEVP